MKINIPKPFVATYRPRTYRSAGEGTAGDGAPATAILRVTGMPHDATVFVNGDASLPGAWLDDANYDVQIPASMRGTTQLVRVTAPGVPARAEMWPLPDAMGTVFVVYVSMPLESGAPPVAPSIRLIGVPHGFSLYIDGILQSTTGWVRDPSGEADTWTIPAAPGTHRIRIVLSTGSVKLKNDFVVPAMGSAELRYNMMDTEPALGHGPSTNPTSPGGTGDLRLVDPPPSGTTDPVTGSPPTINIRVFGFPDGATAMLNGAPVTGTWENDGRTFMLFSVPSPGTYTLRITPTTGTAKELSGPVPAAGVTVVYNTFRDVAAPSPITLLISSIPLGSSVTVDASTTNLTIDPRSGWVGTAWGVPAPTGTHTITVTPPTGTAKSKNVIIPATGQAALDFATMDVVRPPVVDPFLRIVGMPMNGTVYVNGIAAPPASARWADAGQTALNVNLIPGSYTIRIATPTESRTKNAVVVPTTGSGELQYASMTADAPTQQPARPATEPPKPSTPDPAPVPASPTEQAAKPGDTESVATVMLSMPTANVATFRGATVRATDGTLTPMTSVMTLIDNGTVMYTARVPPGSYVMEANFDGSPTLSGTVALNAGQMTTVDIRYLQPVRNGLATVTPPPVPVTVTSVQPLVMAPTPGMSGTKKLMLVGGVALLGATIWYAVGAIDE